jgi:hypothetical protein
MSNEAKCHKYIELLVNALKEFYNEDAEALWTGRKVDERTMVGCISRYVWHGRKQSGYESLLPHIDIEYDKMQREAVGVSKKAFERSIDCAPCDEYETCGKVINEKMCCNEGVANEECVNCELYKERYQFRPDLIVHKRNSQWDRGNGLIVEFKTKENGKADLRFDIARVKYCTCSERDFRYVVGAVVLLCKNRCEVQVFRNGKKVNTFSVNSSGKIQKCDAVTRTCA